MLISLPCPLYSSSISVFSPTNASLITKIQPLLGMRLLLIRHGETVDNVGGVYAGVRDSALTTHGVLQANRLGSYLASNGVKICHIYSSDLQRAFKTAEAVRSAQDPMPAKTITLSMLREQDFGWFEGKPITKGGRDAQREKYGQDEGFRDIESKASMKARADAFIMDHLVEHMHVRGENETVAVVAHGIILNYLWRSILKRFTTENVSAVTGSVLLGDRGLDYLGAWSNTGCLELEIMPNLQGVDCTPASTLELVNAPSTLVNAVVVPSRFQDLCLVVKAVNSLEHLRGLKKTRGGIGSSKHDDKQKTMDKFFKKQRIS
ncbi:histidine phosphatase superfamily [Bisporella sp. PMI_857]|nr:histidine phosphatase superfamily [Bisporella sp. PMI_857]